MTARSLVAALESRGFAVQSTDSGALAPCPSCDDRRFTNLVIASEDGEEAEIECVRGCSTQNVLQALDLDGRNGDESFCSFRSAPRDERHEQKPERPFAAPMSEKLAGVPSEPEWTWQGYLAPGALTLL